MIGAGWAGNASGGALSVKATGLTTDSPIWHGFMVAAHKKMTHPIATFTVPAGLASAQISELSGKLASPCTPTEYRSADIFFEEEVPKEFDDACIEIEVDKLTGLMASDECPLEAREKGSFLRPRSELPDRFPLWEQAVQKWAKDLSRTPQYSRAKLPDLVKPLDINSEKDSIFWKVIGTDASGASVRALRGTGAFLPLPLPLVPAEKCSLALTPGRLIKPSLQIIFPSHGGSASAPAFRPKIEFTVGQSVREVLYELDGKPVARALSGSSLMPMIRLPRRFETAGDHTLKVTIVDSYFNQATDSVRFTFLEDAGIPQVRILGPAEGSTLHNGSEVTMRVEAEDPGDSVDRVQFFLGDQLLTTRRGTSPFELIFVLSAPAGSTTLRAIAIDSAKNEGMDEIVITIVNSE